MLKTIPMKTKQKFVGFDFIAMISSLSKALEKRNLLKRLSSFSYCLPFSIPSCLPFCKPSSIPSSFFLSTLFKKAGFKNKGGYKSLVLYGMGLVFIFSSFFLQAQNSCKALFTPEAVSKPTAHANKTQAEQPLTPEIFAESMTKNLELNKNQKDLFDFYKADYFGDSQTYLKYNFTDIMDTLEKYPELFKPVFKEQEITFEKRHYEPPESLNHFINRFTNLYNSQKGKLFNISKNLHFWKKILGFNKSDQEIFIKYLEQFLTKEDLDFLANTSISYKERAVLLYKVLNAMREDQIKKGKETQKLSQTMLDLVHTVGLGDPYSFKSLKSRNAIDRFRALTQILDAREGMAIELGFEGHFSQLQKSLGLSSPSSFSKKEDIYVMLKRIEKELYQSSSHVVDYQTFRLRALSMQESPFRSCLGGSDCSSNMYFFKALDPNFIYWTLTDKEHRSSGHITVVLGEAKDERGESLLVGFVDKIQNVPTEKIAPMLEGIRRSIEEKGYKLGLPKDIGYHNGLSNDIIISKYIDVEVNPNLKNKLLSFTPHENSYNFSNGYSRAYNQPALYEFQSDTLNLTVKIESGEAHPTQKALENLKKQDLFKQLLYLRNSKKEEEQMSFIKQAGLLYDLKLLSFEELKQNLADNIKDKNLSFKLKKLSFFNLIELYESALKGKYIKYDEIIELLDEFSKSEQKALIGEMSNWAEGNNQNRKSFILGLYFRSSTKEIISIFDSEILEPIIDINFKVLNDRNLLMRAILENKPTVIKLMIKKGIDIQAVDSEGKNALMYAIEYNKLNFVKLLIEKGIDIQTVDSEGKNALMYAIKYNRRTLAKFLIEKSIDIQTVDSKGRNALMYAIKYNRRTLAKFLIEKGIDIQTVDSKGRNALMYAIKYNRRTLAKFLIKKGIDIQAVDSKGRNALMYAIKYNRRNLAKFLIEKGIDIQATNRFGENALILAIEHNQPDLAKPLIEKGIDIHAVDKFGRNVLMLAIEYNQPDLAKPLIEKGIDIHAVDKFGRNVLMLAIGYNQPDLAKPLIEKGIDIHVVDKFGRNVLMLISKINQPLQSYYRDEIRKKESLNPKP